MFIQGRWANLMGKNCKLTLKIHTEDSSGGNIRRRRHIFDSSTIASTCLPCISRAYNWKQQMHEFSRAFQRTNMIFLKKRYLMKPKFQTLILGSTLMFKTCSQIIDFTCMPHLNWPHSMSVTIKEKKTQTVHLMEWCYTTI